MHRVIPHIRHVYNLRNNVPESHVLVESITNLSGLVASFTNLNFSAFFTHLYNFEICWFIYFVHTRIPVAYVTCTFGTLVVLVTSSFTSVRSYHSFLCAYPIYYLKCMSINASFGNKMSMKQNLLMIKTESSDQLLVIIYPIAPSLE